MDRENRRTSSVNMKPSLSSPYFRKGDVTPSGVLGPTHHEDRRSPPDPTVERCRYGSGWVRTVPDGRLIMIVLLESLYRYIDGSHPTDQVVCPSLCSTERARDRQNRPLLEWREGWGLGPERVREWWRILYNPLQKVSRDYRGFRPGFLRRWG